MWVSLPVEAFVMAQRNSRCALVEISANARKQRSTDFSVALHFSKLRVIEFAWFLEHRVGHAHFAHIVKQRGDAQGVALSRGVA